jgi:hypothetical protein
LVAVGEGASSTPHAVEFINAADTGNYQLFDSLGRRSQRKRSPAFYRENFDSDEDQVTPKSSGKKKSRERKRSSVQQEMPKHSAVRIERAEQFESVKVQAVQEPPSEKKTRVGRRSSSQSGTPKESVAAVKRAENERLGSDRDQAAQESSSEKKNWGRKRSSVRSEALKGLVAGSKGAENERDGSIQQFGGGNDQDGQDESTRKRSRARKGSSVQPEKAKESVMGVKRAKHEIGSNEAGHDEGPPKRKRMASIAFETLIWTVLENLGWMQEPGRDPSRNKLFFPPGVTREHGRLRRDYFDSQSQVLDFVKSKEEWKNNPAVIEALRQYEESGNNQPKKKRKAGKAKTSDCNSKQA